MFAYSIFFICALECMFWFAPVLSQSSEVAVSSSERGAALAYYKATEQLGATDAPTNQQARLSESQKTTDRLTQKAKNQQKFDWKQEANSGHGPQGWSLWTMGSVFLAHAMGATGEKPTGGKKKRSVARAGQGGRSSPDTNGGGGSSGGIPGAVLAAAAVGAVAAGRGKFGGMVSARAFSSKRLAPAMNAVRQNAPVRDGASSASTPFNVAPLHNKGSSKTTSTPAKVDCGQGIETKPVALSNEELALLEDADLIQLVRSGTLQAHALEKVLSQDLERAVRIRRAFIAGDSDALANLPFADYDYSKVVGACAENVLGYVPVPVGVAGPVLMDGENMLLPMATTEGCLIASTHRGCKAITESGGATTVVTNDGMTRAPAIQLPSAARAGAMMAWLKTDEAVTMLRNAFESTTRFGKLTEITGTQAGRTVYVRFRAKTGDAMGMNMISKGVEKALESLHTVFPDADVLALSGNMCTDKKPSAVNWINGRGKSVVAEAVIKRHIVESVLKTSVDALIHLNTSKNLVGSAMSGSIGGFNAHASNIVTAMYIATGQDPAQNVESSNCITIMERDGEDLRVSVTMPSIECASIGGGTHLPAQSASLALMGCQGANAANPGANAQKFARAVAVGTLAGELSLMSALCAGHLMRAHEQYNRVKNL